MTWMAVTCSFYFVIIHVIDCYRLRDMFTLGYAVGLKQLFLNDWKGSTSMEKTFRR